MLNIKALYKVLVWIIHKTPSEGQLLMVCSMNYPGHELKTCAESLTCSCFF